MQQFLIDEWLQLLPRRFFGKRGVLTYYPSGLTPTSTTENLKPSSGQSPALVDGLRQELAVEEIKSFVREFRQLSGPSARPISWTTEANPLY